MMFRLPATVEITGRDTATVNGDPVDRIHGIWYYRDARGWVGWSLERRIEREHEKRFAELPVARVRKWRGER